MSWVIVKDNGWFVAPLGSDKSYTKYLQKARIFDTKEQAERELCPENETVRRLEDCIRQ